MTVFESLIQELTQATGLPLRVTAEESCILETEDFPIRLQYRPRQKDIVLLAAVREAGISLSPQTLRKALELAFNGEKTGGCFLGISKDALVLSRSIVPEGMNAKEFAMQLMAFTQHAQDVLAELDADEALQEDDDDFPNRGSFPLQKDGFLQV